MSLLLQILRRLRTSEPVSARTTESEGATLFHVTVCEHQRVKRLIPSLTA